MHGRADGSTHVVTTAKVTSYAINVPVAVGAPQ
jgi:hypothetical protein